jgi:hypothetical protein
MPYIAIFESASKEAVEIPLIQNGGTFLLETTDGRLVEFSETLKDAKHGAIRWRKTVQTPDPMPAPFSPVRAEAIKNLHVAISRFPNDQLQGFFNKNPRIRTAIDLKFVGASVERLDEFTRLITAETERIRKERKAAEPPPEFERGELTRDFRRSRASYGDLTIENLRTPGTQEMRWKDATWFVRCKCEKEGPTTRWATAQVLLQMEDGFTPRWKCGNPCRD